MMSVGGITPVDSLHNALYWVIRAALAAGYTFTDIYDILVDADTHDSANS